MFAGPVEHHRLAEGAIPAQPVCFAIRQVRGPFRRELTASKDVQERLHPDGHGAVCALVGARSPRVEHPHHGLSDLVDEMPPAGECGFHVVGMKDKTVDAELGVHVITRDDVGDSAEEMRVGLDHGGQCGRVAESVADGGGEHDPTLGLRYEYACGQGVGQR